MKRKQNLVPLIALVALIGFTLAACNGDPDDNGLLDLTGNVSIDPSDTAVIGDVLTAAYDGPESVTYQWKRDNVNVDNLPTDDPEKYTTTVVGSYTVTVSADGFNPKTSAAVEVTLPPLTGDITITTTGPLPHRPNVDEELTAEYDGNEEVTFQWKRNGTDVGTASATNPNTYTPTASGSYTVTVSAADYSPETSDPVVVTNYFLLSQGRPRADGQNIGWRVIPGPRPTPESDPRVVTERFLDGEYVRFISGPQPWTHGFDHQALAHVITADYNIEQDRYWRTPVDHLVGERLSVPVFGKGFLEFDIKVSDIILYNNASNKYVDVLGENDPERNEGKSGGFGTITNGRWSLQNLILTTTEWTTVRINLTSPDMRSTPNDGSFDGFKGFFRLDIHILGLPSQEYPNSHFNDDPPPTPPDLEVQYRDLRLTME